MKEGIKRWILMVFILITGVVTIFYISYFKIDSSLLFLTFIFSILSFLFLLAILELWKFVENLNNRVSQLETATIKKP